MNLRTRRPNFVIFVVWSALIVGWWLKLHLLYAWFYSRMGDVREFKISSLCF